MKGPRHNAVMVVAEHVGMSETEAYATIAMQNFHKNLWYKTGKADYNSSWFCLQTAMDFYDFTFPAIQKAIPHIRDDAYYDSEYTTAIDLGAGVGLSTHYLREGLPNLSICYNNTEGRQADIAAKFLDGRKGFLLYDALDICQKTDVLFAFEFFEHFDEPTEAFRRLTNQTDAELVIMQNSFGAYGYGHPPKFQFCGDTVGAKYMKILFNHWLEETGWELSFEDRVIFARRL